jgi:hypothetical protein
MTHLQIKPLTRHLEATHAHPCRSSNKKFESKIKIKKGESVCRREEFLTQLNWWLPFHFKTRVPDKEFCSISFHVSFVESNSLSYVTLVSSGPYTGGAPGAAFVVRPLRARRRNCSS